MTEQVTNQTNANEIRVAVIGAGMAGKAHAAGYLTAPATYDSTLPKVRLVSIADANEDLAKTTAARFGFERYDTSWQAIVEADDIDVVSVVVANFLHRDIVEALLASGKHVLCEKPLSDNIEDAQAMIRAAEDAESKGLIARIGLTYRRSPAVAHIRDLVLSGELGKVLHFSGHYWTDYGSNPQAPISWRYKGPNGSGALADVGSHLTYLAEFVAGSDFSEVRGGQLSTVITERPKPLGAVVGHEGGAVSDEYEAVENDDVASFSGNFAGGGTATIQVTRISQGHPNTLGFELFCEKGSVLFDFRKPGEFHIFTPSTSTDTSQEAGYRTITLGPNHPYWRGGLAMDAPGVGLGQNEGFVFQARAFLEEVAGIAEKDSLPRCATLAEGLHNMQLIDAVSQSAADNGATVPVPAQSNARVNV
ncbi:Gfo/Idh/MocA family protein [Corynebacterium ammoniagenes]|uniref:Dehydrogenase n=2 Tax=Corynebacterium ammoniagenes TaxID=1697 RepID=A0AAV5G1I2_CORAM|nr:Gfo/Idh/MocA family oxidoreductase [Corynebacterium ammoniagenes]APT82032.1 dehydrogenase [Corynebacterium ammoniagenes DSM 20306]AQS73145.1 dehydrogenase [Corynebacterium ammoniagenes]EFG80427.1 putative bacteriochlorophyll 4-vinyl reductase [Corynebacterium ammoniagenes DSM 20306]GJN41844.1 dehydrogenase [Corynebacterium ammoniagenes]